MINFLLVIGFTDPEQTQSKLKWVNRQLYIQILHLYTSAVKVLVFYAIPSAEVVQEQIKMKDYHKTRDELVHFSSRILEKSRTSRICGSTVAPGSSRGEN